MHSFISAFSFSSSSLYLSCSYICCILIYLNWATIAGSYGPMRFFLRNLSNCHNKMVLISFQRMSQVLESISTPWLS